MRKTAAEAPSLGPAPDALEPYERERWDWVRKNIPGLRAADSLLVELFIQAWGDWKLMPRSDPKRTAQRKAVVDLLGKLGGLPGRSNEQEGPPMDDTARALGL